MPWVHRLLNPQAGVPWEHRLLTLGPVVPWANCLLTLRPGLSAGKAGHWQLPPAYPGCTVDSP